MIETFRRQVEDWINHGTRAVEPESFSREAAYLELGRSGSGLESKTITVPSEPAGPLDDDFAVRSAVIERLRRKVDEARFPEGAWPILHGSYATGTVSEFSDVDVTLILDERSLTMDRLVQLRSASSSLLRSMLLIDPLMHHGITTIFKGELGRYDQSVLPIAALERAVSLQGPRTLDIQWDPALSRLGASRALKRQLSALSKLPGSAQVLQYRSKCVLAVLMLIPSLLVESTRGDYPYKRDSFAMARPFFDDASWSVIETASRIREEWRISTATRRLSAILLPAAADDDIWKVRRALAVSSISPRRLLPRGFVSAVRAFRARAIEVASVG